MRICFHCFHKFEDQFDICPNCGGIYDPAPEEPIHLIPGTILADRYIIGKSVGSGGFGIVYKAWDQKLETIVAVKEFYISRLMTRAQGQKEVILSSKSREEFAYRKKRFLAEAKNMAKFGNHKNVPNVFEYFEENGTAYIIMELLQGMTLSEYMGLHPEDIDMDFAIMVANEVGNALRAMHKYGIIHCDVAPDNIFLCSGTDFKVKLMDLGAAKLQDATDTVVDIILKPGYSPTEQYDNSKNIGPWTDIYALGATLYAMLTGKKPAESTNRKIEDTVVDPKVLNPNISNNLNNSVMKAMAIEQHLRFRNVAEFLKAINGDRKVVPLSIEKKRRKARRVVIALSTFLSLVLVGGAVFQYYNVKRLEEQLKPARISVWYCAEEDSDEKKAMEAVKADFESVFEGVTLELVSYPKGEYELKLSEAANQNKLPALFESTDIGDAVLDRAADLTEVYASEQYSSALFLNQYKGTAHSEKQIPLAVDIPMACVIVNGPMCLDYTSDYFKSPADFGDAAVAVSSGFAELVKENFALEEYLGEEEFLDPENNTAAVLLTSTREINEIKTIIPTYTKKYVFCNADVVYGDFAYFWSIGGGKKEEIAAAEKLLSWMLGNVYQSYLMISECNDGYIPVNERCFKTKIEGRNMKALEETYRNLKFK